MNRLLQSKLSGLEATPVGSRLGLVPETHPLLAGVDRCAEVFAHPPFADQPGLVEQGDCSLGIDFAHHVNAPGRNRQALGGKQRGQGLSQRRGLKAAAQLRRGFAVQCRGLIHRAIPPQEEPHLGLDLCQGGKFLARPEACHPQAVKGLDLVIALGVVDRREEGFDLAIQTQAHHLAQHPSMGGATTKGALVVELVHERPPKLRPGREQMGPGGRSALVQVLRQADGVTVKVEGMEVLNHLAPAQVFGNDVGGLNGVDGPRHRPRIVGRCVVAAQRMGQAMFGQDALDRGATGQGLDFEPLQVAHNGAGTNQSIARVGGGPGLQGSPQPHDGLFGLACHLLGPGARGTRAVGKVGGGVAMVLVPPLVQPPRTAVEVLTDVAHPLTLQPSAHGLASQPLFDRLSIHDSSSMEKSCCQSERCREYVCLLASERCPERSYRNDVLIIEN